ncbi:MAG: tetratricopeptide repeat protein [Pseudomonadota bacterium]
MANELFKQDLKRPDEFQSLFGRILETIVVNRTRIYLLGGALAILAVWGMVWSVQSEKRNQTAAGRLAQILEQLPKGEGAPDWQKTATDLDQFLKENGSTSLAPSAKLYRGKALMALGRYDEAATSYREAAHALPKPERFLALEGEGTALMELKQWGEAEARWAAIASDPVNPSRALHTWNLALTQEAGNRTNQAVKTYQDFETAFPDSKLLEKVRSRLTVLRQGTSVP